MSRRLSFKKILVNIRMAAALAEQPHVGLHANCRHCRLLPQIQIKKTRKPENWLS